MAPKERRPRGQLTFRLLLALAIALGVTASLLLERGGVWESHVLAGQSLLGGQTPDPPGYPMWGYSILAALLGTKVLFVQATLCFLMLSWWYGGCCGSEMRGKENAVTAQPALVVVLILPFVFVCLSWYSNSVAFMLAFAGSWALSQAVEREQGSWMFAASGVCFGLAYNFRTEMLMFGLAVGLALVLLYWRRKLLMARFAKLSAFFGPLLLCTIPWLTYTYAHLDRPTLSTTNAGAVMYLGLGTLEGNPWGVADSDDFVRQIASERGYRSPWGSGANRYFAGRYWDAIESQPIDFGKRVAIGIRQLVGQGVYLPNLRAIASRVSGDQGSLAQKIDCENERVKGALGLNVNEQQLADYKESGACGDALHIGLLALVLTEYGIRFAFLLSVAGLFGVFLVSLRKKPAATFLDYVVVSHIALLVLFAGLVQTLPRHTTIIVPILLSAVLAVPVRASQTDG